MTYWLRKHPGAALGAGFVLGLLVGVGILIGAVTMMAVHGSAPEVPLHATATSGGDTFAMATGQISDGTEGVFFLDFLTGELQCCVLDRRTNLVAGYFAHNVIGDLETNAISSGKNPQYLLVTGLAPGMGAIRRADSFVYVADAKTGKFAVYMLPWMRGAVANRVGQRAPMSLVFKGSARNLVIRGQ